jgi:hypothetical protein
MARIAGQHGLNLVVRLDTPPSGAKLSDTSDGTSRVLGDRGAAGKPGVVLRGTIDYLELGLWPSSFTRDERLQSRQAGSDAQNSLRPTAATTIGYGKQTMI